MQVASETYLDFCFIQEPTGTLTEFVNRNFQELFKFERRLHWHLEKKMEHGAEIVVAEVKGMSRWASSEDIVEFLEAHAEDQFWKTLQGYQFKVYPVSKGCIPNGR